MNAQQKEDLRHVILEILALRHPTALSVSAIRRRAENEVDFKITDEDVEATLEFLRGLCLMRYETDGLGSTKHWQATTSGVLAHERGEIPNPPHSAE